MSIVSIPFKYYTPPEICKIINQLYIDMVLLKSCVFWMNDCDRISEIITFLQKYYPDAIRKNYKIVEMWWFLQNYLVRYDDFNHVS